MAVYGVAQITIDDREAYQEYIDGFRPLFFSHGAELLAVDDDVEVVEGDWPHTRFVITKFDSRDAFYAFYNSPEYQALVAIRKKVSTGNMVLVDQIVL